ncbi:hypothetical protein CPB84DRAFT_1941841 [Gymnopilus junonius]|uniref:Uncharacterized protein n=1 Tax=Gymnopilus junonius TaxID=109634 RepID=A0A9P5NJU1_GYMJU|nr:hypothetical protein CPB84DRAFT_1941841 [Gymnopilus junonius]
MMNNAISNVRPFIATLIIIAEASRKEKPSERKLEPSAEATDLLQQLRDPQSNMYQFIRDGSKALITLLEETRSEDTPNRSEASNLRHYPKAQHYPSLSSPCRGRLVIDLQAVWPIVKFDRGHDILFDCRGMSLTGNNGRPQATMDPEVGNNQEDFLSVPVMGRSSLRSSSLEALYTLSRPQSPETNSTFETDSTLSNPSHGKDEKGLRSIKQEVLKIFRPQNYRRSSVDTQGTSSIEFILSTDAPFIQTSTGSVQFKPKDPSNEEDSDIFCERDSPNCDMLEGDVEGEEGLDEATVEASKIAKRLSQEQKYSS